MNGRTGWILALVGVLVAGRPVHAQDAPRPPGRGEATQDTLRGSRRGEATQDTLRLSQVVDRALHAYPLVPAAAAARDEAEASLGRARAAWLPSLSLGGSALRYEEPMVVAPLHGFDPRNPPAFSRTLFQGQAGLSYLLFDGGSRGARVDRARAGLGGADAALQAARAGLVARAVAAYLDLATTRETLAAHEAAVAALDAERVRTEHMLAQGKVPRLQLLRARASLSRARAEREQAAGGVETARAALARLTAMPDSLLRRAALAPVEARPEAAQDREAALARARERSPYVLRARSALAGARAGAAEAHGALWPQLSLAAHYLGFAASDVALSREWNAGLQLSYPLFTGGARARAIEGAEAAERAARERLRTTEVDAADAVDEALAALDATRAQVASLEAAVDQFAEVARVEKLALDQGAGVQTDYLSAQAELLSARAALARGRHAAILARLRLARATGDLDPDWVARNLESEP